MGYTLVYTQVLEFFPYLIKGAWISLQIVVLAFFGGMFFGLIFATIRTFGNKLMNNMVIWYVTFFTNTPQLVQIYFLFFALPEFGILLDMVGETNAQYPKEYFSTYHAGNIVNKVWNTARNIGYSNYFINTKIGQITDDHRYVNILANIPSIDIIGWNTTTNTFGDYHHTHKDNMEGIDKNSLKAVGQTVMEVVYQEK